jgi:hypothetical protein
VRGTRAGRTIPGVKRHPPPGLPSSVRKHYLLGLIFNPGMFRYCLPCALFLWIMHEMKKILSITYNNFNVWMGLLTWEGG